MKRRHIPIAAALTIGCLAGGGTGNALVHPAAYPSDCFQRVVSWAGDYATGTCGYVPSGASFVEKVTCRDSWHTYTQYGFRQWFAYKNSTASCPGSAQMVAAVISLAAS